MRPTGCREPRNAHPFMMNSIYKHHPPQREPVLLQGFDPDRSPGWSVHGCSLGRGSEGGRRPTADLPFLVFEVRDHFFSVHLDRALFVWTRAEDVDMVEAHGE